MRVTGQNESPFSFFSILINAFGSFAKAWNYEGEAALRKNENIDYTIVRPGVMVDENPDEKYALEDQGAKMKVSKISYDAVADLLCTVLDFPNTRRATLTAMTAPGGASAWTDILKNGAKNAIGPDIRKYPSSLLTQSKSAVAIAVVAAVVGFLAGLRELALFAIAAFTT